MENKSIFVRAKPQSIKFVENYFYEQEISCNSRNDIGKKAEGCIQISMPYDGWEYFPREAQKDIKAQIEAESYNGDCLEARIGHLAISRALPVHPPDIPEYNEHYRTLALKVPILTPELNQLDKLLQDEYHCDIKHRYFPEYPEIPPVEVVIDVYDEYEPVFPEQDAKKDQLKELVSQITQDTHFETPLTVRLKVKVTLPAELVSGKTSLNIKKLSFSWPSLTSFDSLKLKEYSAISDGHSVRRNEIPVRYHPENGCLEWRNIMIRNRKKVLDDSIRYESQFLYLNITQPGEIYRESEIQGELELEIAGALLSGLRTRFYSWNGRAEQVKQQLISNVEIRLVLMLDDAFSKKQFAPYRQLHFDGVIPSPIRIADIKSILNNRGFQIVRYPRVCDFELQPDQGFDTKHFLLVERAEGGDKIRLWMVVMGKKYTTTRQKKLPGGQLFVSELESGELDIYMRTQFRGNHQVLTREMNLIQTALKSRFQGLRAQR